MLCRSFLETRGRRVSPRATARATLGAGDHLHDPFATTGDVAVGAPQPSP